MIDVQSFTQLEEKVALAITRIRDLSRERDEVRAKADSLQGELDRERAAHGQAREELDRVRNASVDRDEYESRKKEIERRVEELLNRFSELDEVDQD